MVNSPTEIYKTPLVGFPHVVLGVASRYLPPSERKTDETTQLQIIKNLVERRTEEGDPAISFHLAVPYSGEWEEEALSAENLNSGNPQPSSDRKFVEANKKYLAGMYLSGANLRGANLYGVDLKGANLWRANLQRANLRKANLQGVRLGLANLRKANLRKANLQKAFLQGANLWRANLKGANLQGACLNRANLQEAKLGKANMQGASLEEADLRKANLVRTKLQEAKLQEADLRNAILRKANLSKADLMTANLQEADFWGANLSFAEFIGVDLLRADLRKTNLRSAWFSAAQLQQAKLPENLGDLISLSGSNLSGLNLTRHRGLNRVDTLRASFKGASLTLEQIRNLGKQKFESLEQYFEDLKSFEDPRFFELLKSQGLLPEEIGAKIILHRLQRSTPRHIHLITIQRVSPEEVEIRYLDDESKINKNYIDYTVRLNLKENISKTIQCRIQGQNESSIKDLTTSGSGKLFSNLIGDILYILSGASHPRNNIEHRDASSKRTSIVYTADVPREISDADLQKWIEKEGIVVV